jgi:hypothetical protein
MSGDASGTPGEPGLGTDVVHLGRDDQAVQEGGTLAAAIGAGEQLGLAPSARPRNARSAALFVRQILPSSRKLKAAHRLSM